ncbi:hypothetical protein GCM10011571_34070 [Marinithermofilum abyssi]|uniref:Uncharacterized protein n=1 Tax=Marinithermofilum abyssi TaxID=1571185 RepID=A0A8J2VKW9_9BACL|nr:hypothetical protein [Marinithermofilum abyssi]GGE29123.1 hypothetical protein GCM10011571_34070 [Marinithermofilum abyssi]
MAEVKAKITIQGTRPILWHRFGPEAIPLEKKEKTGVAGNDPDEWKSTYTCTRSGQLYLDGSYVFGCLRNAAKYTKSGRGSIQNNVAATLQVEEDIILLDRFMPEELIQDPEEPVYLDVRSVRNPNTKGRNVRYRVAASPGWKATFHITWDATIVSRKQMETVLIDAGKLVGLADGRNIGFGRFVIESFEYVELENAEEASA